MNRTVFGFAALSLCLCLQASAITPQSSSSAPLAKDSAPKPQNIDNVNAAVIAAREATKDKRYADAEALMLKVTESRPELVLPRIELGLAQLGEKKYSDAENSFKIALGIDPESQKRAHSDDFYQATDSPGTTAASATRASRNTSGGTVNSGQSRTPDILGTCYASLGEIYIHEGKVAEAQAAFDTAVKSNPSQAALYLRNETIFFFQAGNRRRPRSRHALLLQRPGACLESYDGSPNAETGFVISLRRGLSKVPGHRSQWSVQC
jgi:tetratricopeptide (TPR) repeat protein